MISLSVSAQMLSPDYGLIGAPMSNFLANSYLTQQVANDLSQGGQAEQRLNAAPIADAGASGLIAEPAGNGTAARKLAQHYPETQRAQAQALFEDLLGRYAGIERQFDIPAGDVGGALAAFLAGSWMAMHNANFPDRHFMPAVRQMRGALAGQPAWQQASAVDRRDMYEQMAIIGMLMAGTRMALAQQPNPEVERRMREAGEGYLRQFMGDRATRLSFTAQGIALP